MHAVEGLVCPTFYQLIGGRCYRFHQHERSVWHADAVCIAENCKLADIRTESDMKAIINHINAQCEAHVGSTYHFDVACGRGNRDFILSKRKHMHCDFIKFWCKYRVKMYYVKT
jgi:hypothetical protein